MSYKGKYNLEKNKIKLQVWIKKKKKSLLRNYPDGDVIKSSRKKIISNALGRLFPGAVLINEGSL